MRSRLMMGFLGFCEQSNVVGCGAITTVTGKKPESLEGRTVTIYFFSGRWECTTIKCSH